MKTVWTLLIVALMATGAFAEETAVTEITIDPHVSVEAGGGLGASGDSLYEFSVMYWADYAKDGGVGVVGIGDDTADGDQSLIVGPGVEFPTGPLYTAALREILPDSWASAFENVTALVRPYGRGALLFDEDFAVSPMAGTGIRLWPNAAIQPTIRTDWISPQGRAKEFLEEGWITSLSVTWFF